MIPEDAASNSSREASAAGLLDANDKVSASPPVAFQILKIMRESDFSTDALLKLVQLDPELTAQLLRLVNSVEFRGRGVTSLQEAVLRLGTAEISDKALSLTVGRLLAGPSTAYCPDPRALWRHSVETALACRYLSAQCRGVRLDADLAFTGGLLHDIGKLVINAAPPEALKVIAEVMEEEGMSGADAELAVLGADHAEIGGLMLRRWNLPAELAHAIRFHHAPEFEGSELAYLIHVGNCCAKVHAGSFGWRDFEESLRPFSLEKLGLPPVDVQECWGKALEDMDFIERFMSH